MRKQKDVILWLFTYFSSRKLNIDTDTDTKYCWLILDEWISGRILGLGKQFRGISNFETAEIERDNNVWN